MQRGNTPPTYNDRRKYEQPIPNVRPTASEQPQPSTSISPQQQVHPSNSTTSVRENTDDDVSISSEMSQNLDDEEPMDVPNPHVNESIDPLEMNTDVKGE